MTLGEIFSLKVGSQIPLNATKDSFVEIKCGDVSMFRGNMGRTGDSMAVRIVERIAKEKPQN
jgi:flagellar motor switch protein FliM